MSESVGTYDPYASACGIVDRLAPLVGAQDEVAGVGRDEAFSAWQRYLEALAAHRPTVLVIEDLHWADTMSARFLAFLGRRLHRWPVLVVGTTRP